MSPLRSAEVEGDQWIVNKELSLEPLCLCSTDTVDIFIDNLLVQIHSIIEIIWWTGLAPWVFGFPFSGSLTSTFLWQNYIDADPLELNFNILALGPALG